MKMKKLILMMAIAAVGLGGCEKRPEPLKIDNALTAGEIAAYLMREAKVCVNEGGPYGRQGAGHIRIVHGCFQDSQRIYRAMERVRAALIQLGREKGLAQ